MIKVRGLCLKKMAEFEGEEYVVLRYTGIKDTQGNPLYEAVNARAEFPKPVVIIPIPLPKERIHEK